MTVGTSATPGHLRRVLGRRSNCSCFVLTVAAVDVRSVRERAQGRSRTGRGAGPSRAAATGESLACETPNLPDGFTGRVVVIGRERREYSDDVADGSDRRPTRALAILRAADDGVHHRPTGASTARARSWCRDVDVSRSAPPRRAAVTAAALWLCARARARRARPSCPRCAHVRATGHLARGLW